MASQKHCCLLVPKHLAQEGCAGSYPSARQCSAMRIPPGLFFQHFLKQHAWEEQEGPAPTCAHPAGCRQRPGDLVQFRTTQF